MEKARIKDAIQKYYDSIGIDSEDTSRVNNVAQARAVLINVLHGVGLHKVQIASLVKRDRSTVHFHIEAHDDNMKFWEGYEDLYDRCSITTGITLKSELTKERIKLLEEKKELIQSQIEKLNSLINE